ncbi:aldehyde dehydrogenase family protein [Hydrogenophaga sp.]|uniref:aldehyde dehydrogenase family protein n=1 Tax=Hydrogenophaga sp. TaxID=1904254 RepID=UPI0025C2F7A6|nr:aldehyde dehydrogenase family protein [Hydrogenophaga sp.]
MSTLQPVNARTGEPRGKPIPASTPEEIDAAVMHAAAAADAWASSAPIKRAQLLRGLAGALEIDAETLVAWAELETALGPVRLAGELERCAFQLRRFAELAEAGVPIAALVEPAVPGAPPRGHPGMMRQRLPLGPVAVFAASAFPFGSSVLGGDTASALAAGCPVIVKAHPGHPGLSQRLHAVARPVLALNGLPEGLVGMVQGAEPEIGAALLRHPQLAAVAFTGSQRSGLALQALVQARTRPIPFFGQLSATNPVVALPEALALRGAELATALAATIAQGGGQFCTSPGVVLLLKDPASDEFVTQLTRLLGQHKPQPMLGASTRSAFDAGVRSWLDHGAHPLLAPPGTPLAPLSQLFQVSAARFLERPALRDEVFGPACLLVRAESRDEVIEALRAVGASLTVTLWGADADTPDNHALVRAATAIAGRVLFSGVPTGVTISPAQHHGGPWPVTTEPQHTSLGDAALDRFLRPVCLQDPPAWLQARRGLPC